MFFQKKSGQFFAQKTGHVLPLRERHQLFLVCLSEHSFECPPGPQQPTLTQGFPFRAAQKSTTFHGGSSKTV
jgi:hypothetical protein